MVAGPVRYVELRDVPGKQRILFSKPKAEQIKQTGATRVITSCDNCRHQIDEIGRHYGHEVTVQSVSELLVEALVTNEAPAGPPLRHEAPASADGPLGS